MSDARVVRVADGDEMAVQAAAIVSACASAAIRQRGTFLLALAGGSTPRLLYARLARLDGIDWPAWQLYWGDERTVPPDHLDSNYRMVKETLLGPLEERGLAPGRVERMRGELAPVEAASMYETTLRAVDEKGLPRFDLILLGMGADAHTASLFPHSPALDERERLVVANLAPQLGVMRLTFTFPLINAARDILFLVTGADKAPALAAVFGSQFDVARWPSQGVHPPDGAVTWLVDEPAAALIP